MSDRVAQIHRTLLDARPDASRELEAPMGVLLASLSLEVNVSKALKKMGLPRRKIDRFLARTHRVVGLWGPPRGRLEWDGESQLSWVDCADTENAWWGFLVAKYHVYLSGRNETGDIDLSDQMGSEEAQSLFFLAAHLEAFVLRNQVESRDAVLGLVEWFYPSGEPGEVEVTLQGPDWLDVAKWLPDGFCVSASRARWLVHQLHNTVVGGQTINVVCKPRVRPGKKTPYRESEKTRRTRLFSKWYEGIQADEEGLYSATSEALAEEMVRGLSGVVLDGTCGIGALAIAAAKLPAVTRVVAVDIHQRRLDMAAHNARVYGVDHRITFVHGRCEEQVMMIDHDVLILDPPWGGRDYDKQAIRINDLSINIEEVLASDAGRIRMKLPRSFAVNDLPGSWTPSVAVDDRGVIKFLVLERPELSE